MKLIDKRKNFVNCFGLFKVYACFISIWHNIALYRYKVQYIYIYIYMCVCVCMCVFVCVYVCVYIRHFSCSSLKKLLKQPKTLTCYICCLAIYMCVCMCVI